MAFESYNAQDIWSSGESPGSSSNLLAAGKLALAAGAAGIGFNRLMTPRQDGTRPLDTVASFARTGGNLSPFQLANTFRVPEFLFPFTSPSYQGLSRSKSKVWDKVTAQNNIDEVKRRLTEHQVENNKDPLLSQLNRGEPFHDLKDYDRALELRREREKVEKKLLSELGAAQRVFDNKAPNTTVLGSAEYVFQADFLKNRETAQYIQKVTGKTQKELHALGLTQEAMLGPNAAEGLVYRANKTGARGTLHVRRGGTETLLSDSMMLMSRDSEIDPLTREVKSTNKAFKGILQALDMWEHGSFDEDRVLASGNNKAGVAFVPSVSGPTKTLGDLYRRSTFFRGISAFEISRFNELAGEYSRQIFGETGAKFTQTVFGIGNQVTPGPASALLGRYAGRAAMLGAGALAVSQSDWIRREYGLPGQAFSAGLTTAGGAYAAWKMGAPNKLVMMGAVASFFGQMTLPGFDKGVLEGLGSTAAGLDVMRGSALNPFGYYRRTLEGFAPGISDWKTGAFLGIGAMMASSMRLPGTGKRISEHIVEKLGSKRLGLSSGIHGIAPDELLNTRDLFWKKLDTDLDPLARGGERWRTATGRRNIYSALKEKLGGHEAASRLMNTEWRTAETTHREIMQNSGTRGVGKDLLMDLQRISLKYENANTFTRSTLMQAEGFASQVFHSFFGADANYDKLMRDQISHLGFSGVTPVGRLGRLATVGLAAMGLQQIFTGGLFGSMESSEDLREIYAGRKMIEVKKARGWEGGSQPFGGGETSYFRPHALSLMVNRTREAGIWGENEDDFSPIKKFLIKNFTYDLERQNYYDRPYPITGGFGEDVPILGGLISSTIGRLIKPPKLMHVEEWAREGAGGTEFRSIYQGSRQEPAYALGAQGPGAPVSPYGISEQAIAMSDQMRQLSGFPGFARNTIQKIITGSQNFRHNQPVLATAGHMDSPTRAFWEADLGGGAFSTELWRRLFPKGPDKVNPIRNNMPSWLPDKFQCISPETLVEVNGNELVPAKDVKEGMLIRTHRGNLAEVSRLWPRVMDIDEKLYEITVGNLPGIHNRVSEQHPFWTPDGWEPAENLLVGDLVGYPIPKMSTLFAPGELVDLSQYADSKSTITAKWIYPRKADDLYALVEYMEKNNILYWQKGEVKTVCEKLGISWNKCKGSKARRSLIELRSGTLQRIPRYLYTDSEDWGVIQGWYLAEGSAAGRNIAFALHTDEDVFGEVIKSKMESLFGLSLTKYNAKNSLGSVWVTSNKVLSKFFRDYIGHNSHDKIMRLTEENWKETLRGLFNGDGFFSIRGGRNRAGLKSVNAQILYQVWQVLLANQIISSTSRIQIDAKGREAIKLAELINFDKAKKQVPLCYDKSGTHSFFEGGYWWTRVKRKIPVAQEELVAIQINGDNSFCLAGVATHNTGDPYANIDWGEARLPGAGYATLHKELQGVDPEEYPLLARMAILSDVAPASVEYRRIAEQVYLGRQQGQYTEAQNNYIDTLDQQAAAKLNQYTFQDQHERAINLPGSGVVRGAWHSGLSALRHVAAPAEYMVPMGFRPTQKLLADYRDPIEAYEQERLYGTQVAFWDKPMRDWFRPAAYSAAHMLGFDGKPMWRREADAVDQKFDELEFHKWMTLALQAEAAGDKKGKNQYMWAASNTRTGINPQGSAMGMYWALPESERSFFNAFSMAQGSERERVLEMVPGDQAHLYKSIWSRMDSGDPTVHSSEGPGVDENYLKAKYYQQQTTDMPSEDWVGWHSEVDMSDIKVKYAEKYAQDIADYGVWESQVKKAEGQEFLEGSEGYIGPPGTIAAEQIRSRLWNMSGNTRNRPSVSVFPSTSGTRAHMIYNDHRDGEIVSGIQKAIFGGY